MGTSRSMCLNFNPYPLAFETPSLGKRAGEGGLGPFGKEILGSWGPHEAWEGRMLVLSRHAPWL